MREILFRAKRKNWRDLPKKEWWVEGYFFDDGFQNPEHYFVGGIEVVPYRGTADDEWDITGTYFCEIDPETLCQYTGLKDKNGGRIWENDIIRVENSIDEGTGMVEFYGGMWYVDKGVNNSLYDIMLYDDEAEVCVMGNIFDNPELLGQDDG